MERKLSQVPNDVKGSVTAMDCGESLIKRLHAFGFVPGTEVTCRYRSPDGGVAAVELRQTMIAMRTRDLENIRVRIL